MTVMTDTRQIGVITGAHGIWGNVVVKPFDPEASWGETLRQVVLVGSAGSQHREIRRVQRQPGKLVVTFKDIHSRTEAEALKGLVLEARETDLPPPDTDEFYVETLEGLSVVSHESQTPLGTVVGVLSAQGQDFLEVQSPRLTEPVLVPFLTVFIPEIDMVRQTLFVRGLDSLFQEA